MLATYYRNGTSCLTTLSALSEPIVSHLALNRMAGRFNLLVLFLFIRSRLQRLEKNWSRCNMNPNPHIVANPGVVGATVSLGSGLAAWCADAQPIIQFVCTILGGIAALVSIAWVLKQWHAKAK